MKTLVFAQKHQEQAPKTTKSLYTGGRSKDLGLISPVLQNTSQTAVATSTVKRGFVSSKFWALGIFVQRSKVTGEMGLSYPNSQDRGRSLSVRTPARLFACFEHLVHPMRFKTQMVGYLIQTGIQTMTAINQANRAATPQTAQIHAVSSTGTIATSNISAVLAAFNASNMAASYIERGSFAAARRKLTQALAAINQLQQGA